MIQTENPAQRALIPSDECESDYTLRENSASCWITVGDLSVYILRTDDGVSVEVLRHFDEMGDVLAGCEYRETSDAK